MNFSNLKDDVNSDSFRRIRKLYMTTVGTIALTFTLGLDIANASIFGVDFSSSKKYLLFTVLGILFFYARYRYKNISRQLKTDFMNVRRTHFNGAINLHYRSELLENNSDLRLGTVQYNPADKIVEVEGSTEVQLDRSKKRYDPYKDKIPVGKLKRLYFYFLIDKQILKESDGLIFELYLPNIISLYLFFYILIYLIRGFFLMS